MSGFGVERDRRGDVEIVRLTAPGDTRVEVVPVWGASVVSFHAGGEPVLEDVAFEEVAKKPTSYGIPILFPFPNRVRDGRFTFEGREVRVDPPRHGFVRDKPWAIVADGAGEADGAWVTLGYEAATYPFPFVIEMTYRLREAALTLAATARNTGPSAMPAGFGIHPYFHAPERGTVAVPASGRWELAESLPTGRIVGVEGRYDLRQPKAIADLELDDVFTSVTPDADGLARCAIRDPRGSRTVVELDPQSLPEVVVYTPPKPRRAICVEPQSCPTDAFNLAARGIDAHVVTLAPRQEARWSVAIRRHIR